jgi:cell division transport system ATP-binding protein
MQMFDEFKQVGVTVLIATHDIDLIHRLDHRVLTLDKGHLVACGA